MPKRKSGAEVFQASSVDVQNVISKTLEERRSVTVDIKRQIRALVDKIIVERGSITIDREFGPVIPPNTSSEKSEQILNSWSDEVSKQEIEVRQIENSIAALEMLLDKTSTSRTTSRKGKKGILLHIDPSIDANLKQMAKTHNLTVEYLLHRAIYLLFQNSSVYIPPALEDRLSRPAVNVGGRPRKTPTQGN